MSAAVLSGRELSQAVRADVGARVEELARLGRRPAVAVVTATDDAATAAYVTSIVKAATKLGMESHVADLGGDAPEESVRAVLRGLSQDDRFPAVILQAPVPAGLVLSDLAADISPEKDIDGASPLSLGRLCARLPAFPPATAEAVVRLLDHHGVALAGREVVVVGRSVVVGKPLAHLLLDRDATVTVTHSRTVDLPAVTSRAEIVIAAAGSAHLITAAHVRPGAVVVDVGTNDDGNGGLAGDVDPAVAEVASALSPVPGGVGPVTTAVLLEHAVAAAERVPA